MAGSQRVYRQRIRSTQALKKMFRAQELIAASRIGKARDRMAMATPYSRAITRAVSALATHSDVSHPFLVERHDTHRAAVHPTRCPCRRPRPFLHSDGAGLPGHLVRDG